MLFVTRIVITLKSCVGGLIKLIKSPFQFIKGGRTRVIMTVKRELILTHQEPIHNLSNAFDVGSISTTAKPFIAETGLPIFSEYPIVS